MIKTRFAPSPTGYLHVGGLRTALYAYLFAKQNKGIFALRIEDTDQNRYVEGAVEGIQSALQFFGLNWDEGPIFQSKRTELYRKFADQLLADGHAYRCFCSAERLEKMREAQQARKEAPKYDRLCCALSPEEVQAKLDAKETYVIRQLIPNEFVELNDLIRGTVEFHGKDVDDQVLIKSDGFPTYHLANVVDDHDMEITHVIRGEEWLPSTPKHVWLYQALGWTPPEFAHLPLLLNPDKSKLSKRQGDVAAEDYINKGYLPEALINFVALLGWNPGTEEEFFTLPQLIERFSLDRVQKAGAVFNLEKLDWLNGHYMRELPLDDLAARVYPLIEDLDWYKRSDLAQNADEEEFRRKALTSIQTRMKTLNDAPDMLKPFLLDHLDYDLKLFQNEKMKVDKATAIMALENSLVGLSALEDYSNEESIKATLTDVITKLGMKNGQVLWPLRIAMTNEEYSPGVFELILIYGKEKTLARLRDAISRLQ